MPMSMFLLCLLYVIVIYPYTAIDEDDLTIKVGDLITNVSKEDEGWYTGTLNGQRGLFPSNYAEVLLFMSDVYSLYISKYIPLLW